MTFDYNDTTDDEEETTDAEHGNESNGEEFEYMDPSPTPEGYSTVTVDTGDGATEVGSIENIEFTKTDAADDADVAGYIAPIDKTFEGSFEIKGSPIDSGAYTPQKITTDAAALRADQFAERVEEAIVEAVVDNKEWVHTWQTKGMPDWGDTSKDVFYYPMFEDHVEVTDEEKPESDVGNIHGRITSYHVGEMEDSSLLSYLNGMEFDGPMYDEARDALKQRVWDDEAERVGPEDNRGLPDDVEIGTDAPLSVLQDDRVMYELDQLGERLNQAVEESPFTQEFLDEIADVFETMDELGLTGEE